MISFNGWEEINEKQKKHMGKKNQVFIFWYKINQDLKILLNTKTIFEM